MVYNMSRIRDSLAPGRAQNLLLQVSTFDVDVSRFGKC